MFLLSAVLTGTLYVGALYLCEKKMSLNPYLSVTLAFIASSIFYFVSNKLVVFRDAPSTSSLMVQIGQFAIVVLVNYAITISLVWAFKYFTGEVYSGSVAAGIVTTILAYLVFDTMFSGIAKQRAD